jgi:hypothetical protein
VGIIPNFEFDFKYILNKCPRHGTVYERQKTTDSRQKTPGRETEKAEPGVNYRTEDSVS